MKKFKIHLETSEKIVWKAIDCFLSYIYDCILRMIILCVDSGVKRRSYPLHGESKLRCYISGSPLQETPSPSVIAPFVAVIPR